MISRFIQEYPDRHKRGVFRRFEIVLALAVALVVGPIAAYAEPWKFGILADTQWRIDDDGQNPNTIPAAMLKQVDREFVRHGVKLVVAVGDTVNNSTKDNIDARALYAQDLYNAGVGFYPLRGNHEAAWAGPTGSGPEFGRVFPQTRNGVNNATPTFAAGLGVDKLIAPDRKTNSNAFIVGSNFGSPNLTYNGVWKAGLTYSFDYENVRFVLLDQFDDSGNTNTSTIADQQDWINARLSDPKRPQHAFVFGHKNLLGARHQDNLFGGGITPDDPGDGDGVELAKLTPEQRTALAAKQAAETAFISALAAHGVYYYISGHDHLHDYSIVTSPNGSARIRQLICQAVSANFPVPDRPMSAKKMPLSQDVCKVGYYVCTVDGPRVTVDYYGAPVTPMPFAIFRTSDFTGKWQKLETFGYSLNGREFLVAEGESYATVQDDTTKAIANGETGYVGTTAKILAGTNRSTAKTSVGKPCTKDVTTGWSPAAGTVSDVFTLWGMADIGAAHTDTYVASLSFPPAELANDKLNTGEIVLATKGGDGKWTNAVDANVTDAHATSKKQFIPGPYDSGYALGTYGFDTATNTAWAVVNYGGDFAVTVIPKPE